MKKTAALLLAIILILSVALTACKLNPDVSEGSEQTEESELLTDSEPPANDDNNDLPTNGGSTPTTKEKLEFIFTSKGNGECAISGVIVNGDFDEKLDIVYPDKSPDGEDVVEVNGTLYDIGGLPAMLLPEDYEKICDTMGANIEKAIAEGKISAENVAIEYRKLDKFFSYYTRVNLEEALQIGQSVYDKYLKDYPILAAIPDIYVLDMDYIDYVGNKATQELLDTLYQYGEHSEQKGRNYYNALVNKTVGTDVSASSVKAPIFPAENILSVKLPSTVKTIDGFARYSSLTSIDIPDSVESIGNGAFEGCTGLNAVYIKDIASWCNIKFHSNPLSYAHNLYLNGTLVTDLVIPSGVTTIKYQAFSDCTNLKSVTIPNSVTTIESNVFSNCTNLESITIPNSVTFIGDDTFSGCTSLVYNEYDNAYYLGNENNNYLILIKTKSKDITSCQIHNNTKLIGYGGWFGYSNESYMVSGPIDYFAFSNCTNLTSITIPNGVTNIGAHAFDGCIRLTSITIPNSVISIGSSAFDECTSLESVTIGNSIESIGNSAFYECTSLTSITIPDSVTSIGAWAFSYCTSLESITIPDSVTSIGRSAFSYCTSLESITIPDSVTSIGDYAFGGCYKLVEVYNLSSLTIERGSDLNGYVGYYALDIYTSTDSESKLHTDDNGYIFYVNGETVYLIGYKGEATELTLPSNYNGSNYIINQYAFGDCDSLTSINIPDGVNSIGDWAFYRCTSLESITIPDSVTNIGECAFWGCGSLESITYTGTIDQWNTIEKDGNWDSNIPDYFITCTDGTIAKDGTVTYS